METTREEKLRIANTILKQMGGGGRLRAMIGMHSQVALDSGLQFSFKGCRAYNKCRVTYNYGSDTYTFALYQLSRKYPGKVNREFVLEDVYCDMLVDLFQDETGLRLSLGTMGR